MAHYRKKRKASKINRTHLPVIDESQTVFKCCKCKHSYSKAEMSYEYHLNVCKACAVSKKKDNNFFSYITKHEYENGFQRLIKKNTALVLRISELEQIIDKLTNKETIGETL